MGYYTRVFCTSDRVPKISDLIEWMQTQGIVLDIDPDFQKVDLNSGNWEQVGFVYKKGKHPFLSEINVDNGSENCLLRLEIAEYKEILSSMNGFINWNKKKVMRHLENTKFIVANQIPTLDFDEDGYEANGEFMKYFVNFCGGMIQADNEGFYIGNKLVVKLD